MHNICTLNISIFQNIVFVNKKIKKESVAAAKRHKKSGALFGAPEK